MIWPSSMEKRWFRRFVSLVSLTLGNSVRSKMLLTALIICVSLLLQIFEFTEKHRIMVQTGFRIMWTDLRTMENLSLLQKMGRMT